MLFYIKIYHNLLRISLLANSLTVLFFNELLSYTPGAGASVSILDLGAAFWCRNLQQSGATAVRRGGGRPGSAPTARAANQFLGRPPLRPTLHHRPPPPTGLPAQRRHQHSDLQAVCPPPRPISAEEPLPAPKQPGVEISGQAGESCSPFLEPEQGPGRPDRVPGSRGEEGGAGPRPGEHLGGVPDHRPRRWRRAGLGPETAWAKGSRCFSKISCVFSLSVSAFFYRASS